MTTPNYSRPDTERRTLDAGLVAGPDESARVGTSKGSDPTTKGDMPMSFTNEESAYLRSQPVTRFATVGPDGQPDVVPLAFEFDGHGFWVGGVGDAVVRTRKFRNVAAGNDRVALVFDDLISIDPFAARCLRVYGRASEPVERVSMQVGPGVFMRITPTISWSWNLEGKPAEKTWDVASSRKSPSDTHLLHAPDEALLGAEHAP
jgi:pyridoxamine 5'-phosphate oxidase family protein